MKVKFREVGNSITVTIPKDIVLRLGLKQGMEADIDTDDSIITVEPIRTNMNVTIKSLFADYHRDYKPSEIDWGKTKGNEVW